MINALKTRIKRLEAIQKRKAAGKQQTDLTPLYDGSPEAQKMIDILYNPNRKGPPVKEN